MKKLLVVVDMQKDFIDGALGTPEAQAIVPAVVEKIAAFAGDVVYTRDTHSENYLETAEGKKLPVVHCVKGTPGWELHPEVERAGAGKTAAVIDKPTFGSTELADLAEQGGYEAIELIGLCTDICVISNALGLKARLWETPIAVWKDCCAGVTPQSHENALAAMAMCQIDIL
ncbi:MAG: cysteine hydrolase [Oscillibacter sp.]|nr:cysteine hydrolase [Oscillibacter sp.]